MYAQYIPGVSCTKVQLKATHANEACFNATGPLIVRMSCHLAIWWRDDAGGVLHAEKVRKVVKAYELLGVTSSGEASAALHSSQSSIDAVIPKLFTHCSQLQEDSISLQVSKLPDARWVTISVGTPKHIGNNSVKVEDNSRIHTQSELSGRIRMYQHYLACCVHLSHTVKHAQSHYLHAEQ